MMLFSMTTTTMVTMTMMTMTRDTKAEEGRIVLRETRVTQAFLERQVTQISEVEDLEVFRGVSEIELIMAAEKEADHKVDQLSLGNPQA
jgi:hypothetical protein